MKVLLVSSSSGSRGGGELYLRNLAGGLLSLGLDCKLLMASHPQMDELAERCQTDGIEVCRFEYTNTYHRRLRSIGAALDGKQVRSAIAEFKSHTPDLIHLNQQNVEDALDLMQAAAGVDIPVVTTVHQPSSMAGLKALAGRTRDWVARRVFRRASIPAIAVSTESGRTLSQFLGRELITDDSRIAQDSVVRVFNGVPQPEHAGRATLRADWGLGDREIALGCLGRIEHEKNPLFVARLLSELPEHVHVVWIGDGRLRVELEAEISRLNLGNRFHILGWQDNAARLLAGMDLFLLPSLYEGLPLALLEAMAVGLPVIASDIPGTRDAFVDSESGLFCPVNDLEAWRSACDTLCSSEQQREEMGAAAVTRYTELFSLTAMAEGTLRVYQHLLATQSS